jgi:hypothetical protein
MVSKWHIGVIRFCGELRLNCSDNLLQRWSNFFLRNPRVIVSGAIPSPEQVRIFRCHLVDFVENVLKCVLRDVAWVRIVWWSAPLARFYCSLTSFRLCAATISKSTVSGCSNFVLSVEVGVWKMDKCHCFSLSKWFLVIKLIDEALSAVGHLA